MSGRTRRIWFSTVAVVAGCLSLAALAWACTPEATLQMTASSGAPGTPLTFTGSRFANGPVQIRMDSTTSAPIATATGPSFSVTITVPNTTPGYHVFGAVGEDSSGNVTGESSVAFKVTGSAAPAPPTAPVPAHKPTAQPKRSHPVTSHRTSSPAAQTHPARTPSVAQAPALTHQLPAAPHAPASAAAIPSTPSTAAVPATHARSPETRPQTHAAIRPGRLRPHDGHTRPRVAHSSLTPTSHGVGSTESGGSVPWVAIGSGVLGAGLVALFGGFAVAELRRRRALARSRRR